VKRVVHNDGVVHGTGRVDGAVRGAGGVDEGARGVSRIDRAVRGIGGIDRAVRECVTRNGHEWRHRGHAWHG
jgi:hypothetical protein